MSNLNPDQFGYRGMHSAPDKEGNIPMHRAAEAFPDIHQHPEYYHHGDDETYGKSLRDIGRGRDNPDQPVWMYRAMPPEAVDAAASEGRHPINPGDWVTTSKAYAKQHAMQDDDPSHDWPVVAKRVKARHLYTEGNDVNEWAYHPD